MCNLSSFSTIFVEGKTLSFWRLAPMVLRTLTGTQLRCLAFHEKRRGPVLAFIKPLETSSSAPAWRRWPGHSERWRSAKVCFTFLLLSFWVSVYMSENISLHTISWHNILSLLLAIECYWYCHLLFIHCSKILLQKLWILELQVCAPFNHTFGTKCCCDWYPQLKQVEMLL